MLENLGSITKGEFDRAERLITELRKAGLLPLSFCAESAGRAFLNVESIDDPPEDHAVSLLDSLDAWIDAYSPFSFWRDEQYYVQMLVEKIDLRELFVKICAKYHVPLANAIGWSDLNCRAELIARFKEHERRGRTPVLLYCGDFDPVGVKISETMRKNLADLADRAGWTPDSLIIDRFGLNAEFIEAHRIPWIEGLETGSGKDLASPRHPDHKKRYVQEWLQNYGARKVEANALVINPQAGRKLCEDAILRYVSSRGAPAAHTERLRPHRELLQRHVSALLAQRIGGVA
jgi:hypothetical protein